MEEKTLICTFCKKKINSKKINVIDHKEGTLTCEDCFLTDDWLNEDIDK